MLDAIKKGVFEEFNAEEKKGIFLSAFDASHKLLLSQGILATNEPLRVSLQTLYTTYVEKILGPTAYVVCDVVANIIEINNPADMLSMSPEEYGFAVADVSDDISGVLLPNTAGVADAKSALYSLKKKYGIHGEVTLFAFRTERIVVAK